MRYIASERDGGYVQVGREVGTCMPLLIKRNLGIF